MTRNALSSGTAVCTIISKNYLAFARTLMQSVRQAHPDWQPYVLLVDELQGRVDPSQEAFTLVRVADLPLPNRDQFFFRYTLLELSTAVKPWFLNWLFSTTSAEHVVYLDPDIYVYRPLVEVEQLLRQGALMVLTPHLTGELDDKGRPHELDILQAGCYNLGFLGLARHSEVLRFLSWWQRKLERDCRVSRAEGLFVDQRWMDLAPGLFTGVAILRHPGYNVAYWNLNHRPVRLLGGAPWVGPEPLVFFHFSGLNPEAPGNFSRHQNRFRTRDLGAAGELVTAYCQAVLSNGWKKCRDWSNAFGFLNDGTPIPDCVRHYYRSHPGAQERAGANPFAHGHDYLNEPWGHREPLVTRLLHYLWAERPDIQEAYPDIGGADGEDFARYFIAELAAEVSIPENFVAPVRDALRQQEAQTGRSAGPCRPAYRLHANPMEETSHPASPIIRTLARLALSCLPLPASRLRLRKWARWLRPLARFLPEGLRNDLKRDLRRWLKQRPGVRRSWGVLVVLPLIGQLMHQLWEMIRGGARKGADQGPQGEPVALRLHQPPKQAQPHGSEEPPSGINLIGYLNAATGVGESVRLCARAAAVTGLPVSLHDVARPPQSSKTEPRSRRERREPLLYPVNLFHINADQMPVALGVLGSSCFADRYNIGYWHWELPEFPERWLPSFDLVDEVWVPSRFIQDALSAKSPRPVLRMPHGIGFEVSANVVRTSLELPPDDFLFLMMFDVESFQMRKNPEGAIEAFRRAFAGSRNVSLVLKVNHAGKHLAGVAQLKSLVAGLPNVRVVDRAMSRQEVYDLQSLCDCYVSLHRSEGFGLGLAEAMFLGKPVIATGWSGNQDFMTHQNSCPVSYRLVHLEHDVGPYARGQVWAEPDLDEAAQCMRQLVKDVSWRERIAAMGQQTIRKEFAPERVGRLYRERLEMIGVRSGRQRQILRAAV